NWFVASRGHQSTVWAVGFSPDGQTLLSGSGDGTLALWRARDGQRLRTLGGDLGSVRAIALSPDGQTLVGGGQNGTIKVWQVNQQSP
ncbi:hypothetical protein HC928_22920, partial [bacterium]|nr:hypothetical protein [bacterium]